MASAMAAPEKATARIFLGCQPEIAAVAGARTDAPSAGAGINPGGDNFAGATCGAGGSPTVETPLPCKGSTGTGSSAFAIESDPPIWQLSPSRGGLTIDAGHEFRRIRDSRTRRISRLRRLDVV